jgi:serine protease Do
MSITKSLFLTLLITPLALALSPEQAQKLYDQIAPSLVVIQYNYEGELQRQEVLGQGVVVGEDGLVMTSMALFPVGLPDEQMKDFKIVIPGDEEKELDAVFLGRDERSDMAFLKVKSSAGQKWHPVKFDDLATRIAEPIISVGLLPKDAGYKAYYAETIVSANLRGPIPMVMVSPTGLATVGSPVFNADGKAIGFVEYQQGANPFLNRNQGGLNSIAQPARFFVPTRDFMQSLQSPPTGKPLPIPWVGADLTAVNKEVAEYYNLKGTPVAQIGEVIPDSPASKAGIKTGDKIIKVNGQGLERGDEPEETPQILLRKIHRMTPGEKVTFTVLREKDKPPVDVPLTLEERPMQPSQAKRSFFDDLGFGVRQLVFADTYSNHMPADTKGVVVSVVRPQSSASSAHLQGGDIVKEINKEPVSGLEDFKQKYDEFRKSKPKEQVVLVITRKQRTEVIKMEAPQ